MKVESVDKLTITECCELLGIDRQQLFAYQWPGSLSQVDQTVQKQLKKLLKQDELAYRSCVTVEQYAGYLATWSDGMWRDQATKQMSALRENQTMRQHYEALARSAREQQSGYRRSLFLIVALCLVVIAVFVMFIMLRGEESDYSAAVSPRATEETASAPEKAEVASDAARRIRMEPEETVTAVLIQPDRDHIISLINTYNRSLVTDDFDRLRSMYSDPVRRFYDARNIARDELIANLRSYDDIFGVTSKFFDVQWKTLKVSTDGNTIYVNYDVDYRIVRIDKNKPSKFYLTMYVELDQDYRICSIYEQIVKRSK